jgi:hypothetical protein
MKFAAFYSRAAALRAAPEMSDYGDYALVITYFSVFGAYAPGKIIRCHEIKALSGQFCSCIICDKKTSMENR